MRATPRPAAAAAHHHHAATAAAAEAEGGRADEQAEEEGGGGGIAANNRQRAQKQSELRAGPAAGGRAATAAGHGVHHARGGQLLPAGRVPGGGAWSCCSVRKLKAVPSTRISAAYQHQINTDFLQIFRLVPPTGISHAAQHEERKPGNTPRGLRGDTPPHLAGHLPRRCRHTRLCAAHAFTGGPRRAAPRGRRIWRLGRGWEPGEVLRTREQ